MDFDEMYVTPEEQRLLDWCYSVLPEENIDECHHDAIEAAAMELNEDDGASEEEMAKAAELLVALAAKIILRHVRGEQRSGLR